MVVREAPGRFCSLVALLGLAHLFGYFNLIYVTRFEKISVGGAGHAIGTLALAGLCLFQMCAALETITDPSSPSYQRIQTSAIVSTWTTWMSLIAKWCLDWECEFLLHALR